MTMTSATKERPILFSAPMVRAVQKGIKTQTRRLINPQPTGNFLGFVHRSIRSANDPKVLRAWFQAGAGELRSREITCPYGAPGDRLWVRETWAAFTTPTYEYGEADLIEGPVSQEEAEVVYSADGQSMPERWRPSIFMPRWASRILLEVTEVRVERLQDISEEDARAEGLSTVSKDGSLWKWGIPDADGLPGTDDDGWPWHDWERSPVAAYRRLWESIHGPGSWDLNPWVWAVTFRKLQP
jgi:hypothetical protein